MSIAIVRMNPAHMGHKYLIEEMGKESKIVYIGLGSCQEERTLKNPYSPKERSQMIRNMFPNQEKYKIFFLNDFPDCTKKEWQDYCLKELKKQCGEDSNPKKYFGGCDNDITWWKNAKNLIGENIQCVSLCRENNNHLSATEIRKSLRNFLAGKTMNIKWVKEIPEENLEFVKNNYPKELIFQD